MSEGTASPESRSSLARLPRGIWALGFVSLFMDISSEMIHGLLPVFLTSVLRASTEMIGLIEGVGEATASISKLFSGWVSVGVGHGGPQSSGVGSTEVREVVADAHSGTTLAFQPLASM
jgi:hypothetical protein